MDNKKSLGQAIDELINALKDLDDNSKVTAVKAVVEHLNIPIGQQITSGLPKVSSSNDSLVKLNNNATSNIVDIQTLKENKLPSNSIEMACIVAFYLNNNVPENERMDWISSKEIEKYFKQAKFPLPKVISQVLIDAKAAGYFDSGERGKYKLNPVGYNLVEHKLPRPKN